MVESKYHIETSDHLCDACRDEISWGGRYFSTVVYADEQFGRRNYCLRCWEKVRTEGSAGVGLRGAPELPRAEGPVSFFAFWKTRRPEAAGEPRGKIRFEPRVVLDFFRHLTPAEDSGDGQAQEEDEASAEPGADVGVFASREASAAPDATPAAGDSPEAHGMKSTGLYPTQRRDLRFVLSLLLLRKKLLVFESSALDGGREWLKLTEKEDRARVWWVENPELTDAELERVRDDVGDLLQMNL